MNSKWKFLFDIYNPYKDQFCLEPKIELDSGPKSPNNKFIENGKKASLNLGKRYWKIVLIGKSYICTNTKSILGHALVVWLRVQNSFFLLLYFFNLLLSLIFCSVLPFFLLLVRYILRFLRQFLHPRVSQVLRVSLSLFAPLWTFYS